MVLFIKTGELFYINGRICLKNKVKNKVN